MQPISGLSADEAAQRLAQHGPNLLPRPEQLGILSVFIGQFLSPLIYILLAAAALSLAIGQWSDAGFIFAVLLINAIIGTIQEHSAQQSATALEKMVPHMTTVVRDGRSQRIRAEHIVPGDVICLESGDKIPADIHLEHAENLSVDESLLTGESIAVAKHAHPHTPPSAEERHHFAFAGTMVNRGRGHGSVIATATRTELGKIAKALRERKTAKPPLLQRIERFTARLSVFMVGIIAILFVITWWQGGSFTEMFLLAVALAVSAIPEGLPAAITVTLSIGMRRMAQAHVIIRRLIAVESLGSCTYIASDKTGTLTVNELTARHIILPDGYHFRVTGEGVAAPGEILPKDPSQPVDASVIHRVCRAGVLANEGTLQGDVSRGDSVDIAFLVLGRKCGLARDGELASYHEEACIPYESENSFSASIHSHLGERKIYVKGSPEKLLSMCRTMLSHDGTEMPMDAAAVLTQMEALAASGYRVLALADGTAPASNPSENVHDLTFLGLVSMIDPLRADAKAAVEKCHQAGVKVTMITGDHPTTAYAIAKELGLCDTRDNVVTGMDIENAARNTPQELDTLINSSHVFARINPLQKQQIVESLMRSGHFVAVTGDGVNDAPALKHAHVGVAMGKRGTDVARESADIIITDDHFASLVDGIEAGRVVYNNIRKVIFLLVSTGCAEIVLFLLAIATSYPMPLLAVQLLWLNLVTNSVQHVALAFEPAEGDELLRPPRKPNEAIFNRRMAWRIGINSLFMGAAAFSIFAWLLAQGSSIDDARNITLLLMVVFENIQVLNSQSEYHSMLARSLSHNRLVIISILGAHSLHLAAMHWPALQEMLRISPVDLRMWAAMLGIAIAALAVGEFQKFLMRQKN